jgi:hypothetical protein
MSINGFDYTKQLGKEREYLQETSKKVKEAANKRVEDAEKRTDYVTEKQKETFINDRADLENNYQSTIDHLKKKTEDYKVETSSRYSKDILKEREEFTKNAINKKKDFDKRLNDIRESYSNAFKSENERHEQLESESKTKYNKSVNGLREDMDKKLVEYQDRMKGEGEELKDQYRREREQLVRDKEDRFTELYKDTSEKRADLRDRVRSENKKNKEVQEAEMAQQRLYTQDKLSTVKNNFIERSDAMAKEYNQRNDKLIKDQQRQSVLTNKEYQETLSEVRRGYNENIRKIDLEKRQRDNSSDEYAVQNQKTDTNVNMFGENQLKDDLLESQRIYYRRADEEKGVYNAALKKQKIEAIAEQEQKVNEAKADLTVTFARQNEKSERDLQIRDQQNRFDKAAYEARLMTERTSANERVKKLKETFHSSMKTLEEKHKLSLDQMSEIANKDKTQFQKLLQERRAEEIHDMKRAFGKIMDGTVQDFEQRLAASQRENESLKMNMGLKIQNILDQAEKQIETQRKIFEDRKEADARAQQSLMDARESQLKRNFAEMSMSYQKKIDKMQIHNDTKFKLMTNDYETKLKEQKVTISKEISQKNAAHEIELDRIKQTYDNEKTRIVNAYESQIDTIKQSQEEQIRQMAEFKKLS